MRIVDEGQFAKTYDLKWSDLDPNDHVRHSPYDDYAADARIRSMEQRGYSPARFSEEGFGPVILR